MLLGGDVAAGKVRILCSELEDHVEWEGGREAEKTSDTHKETISVVPKTVL